MMDLKKLIQTIFRQPAPSIKMFIKLTNVKVKRDKNHDKSIF
jgi:hypothetical protein